MVIYTLQYDARYLQRQINSTLYSYSFYGPTKVISVHSVEHISRYCEYLAECKETILDWQVQFEQFE